jgi:uncharacterized membrane protein
VKEEKRALLMLTSFSPSLFQLPSQHFLPFAKSRPSSSSFLCVVNQKSTLNLFSMNTNFSGQAAWILLTLVCSLTILAGLKKILKKAGWETQRQQKSFIGAVVITTVWIALLLILSWQGFFSDFSKLPPRPALAMMIPLPLILIFAFSKTGTQLLRLIPPHWLIFMQTFRIIIELLLFVAFTKGLLPVQMTFEGRNFDIITGILALPVGYWMMKNNRAARRVTIFFNIVGLLLLLNILVIAVLSMPTPLRQFMNEPANTIVAKFPFILLPGLLVPIAYGLHILSLRQLLARKSEADLRGTGRKETEQIEEKLVSHPVS